VCVCVCVCVYARFISSGCTDDLRRDFDRPNTFAVRFSLVQFGSLWFNMASVDITNFENKYDYPDNYESQQHRRSSVAV